MHGATMKLLHMKFVQELVYVYCYYQIHVFHESSFQNSKNMVTYLSFQR